MSSRTEQKQSPLPEAAGTAPPLQTAAAPQGYLTGGQVSRLLFIDNLRVLLICGVVVTHLAITYGASGSWYYRDPATNLLTASLLTILTATGHACGMGLFFLITGYFTPGSYDRKGPTSFLRDRARPPGSPVAAVRSAARAVGGLHRRWSAKYSLQ